MGPALLGPAILRLKFVVITNNTVTNILSVVTQLQLEFCQRIQHSFKYPTNKIIITYITSFRNTANPFQHEICQTVKAQKIS